MHSTSSSRDSGNSRPFDVPPTAWPDAADALQERVDRARRAQLAHQIDIADVDAQLERCGRDQQLQLAALEALLGIEAQLLREAAVMRGDVLFAEALREMPRGALGGAARVHEHERGAMFAAELGEPVVDLRPHFAGHHRFERRRRHFDARDRDCAT